MFCKNCGKELDDNAVVCPVCGVATGVQPVTQPVQQAQPVQQVQPAQQAQPVQAVPVQPVQQVQPIPGDPNQPGAVPYVVVAKKTNGFGIAGFVVSLLAFLGFGFFFAIPCIIGLVLSIVGMVFMKKCNSCNGLAIAGLVFGILSTLIWGIVWLAAGAALVAIL